MVPRLAAWPQAVDVLAVAVLMSDATNQHIGPTVLDAFETCYAIYDGSRAMAALGVIRDHVEHLEEQLEAVRDALQEARDYIADDDPGEADTAGFPASAARRRQDAGATQPSSSRAADSHEHVWSLPSEYGVFRCLTCGIETTSMPRPVASPARSLDGES